MDGSGAVLKGEQERAMNQVQDRRSPLTVDNFRRRRQTDQDITATEINAQQANLISEAKQSRKPSLLQRLKAWRHRRNMLKIVEFRKWLRIPAMMTIINMQQDEIAGLRRDHEAAVSELNRIRGELQQLEQHLKLTRLHVDVRNYKLVAMRLVDRQGIRQRQGNRRSRAG